MIQSLYVDNYKTLVNTKIVFSGLNILIGKSGSGKSTIFEILGALRAFIMGEKRVSECFQAATLTKWQNVPLQTIELVVSVAENEYTYHLEIEHKDEERQQSRVKKEQVLFGDKPIFEANEGKAQLYNDRLTAGPEILSDWSLSGVSLVHPRRDNQLLQQFKQEIEKIVVCAPNPNMMKDYAENENNQPDSSFSNFVAFYKWISQAKPECMVELWQNLKEINPTFVNTSLSGDESMKRLQARYAVGGGMVTCSFNDLSAGEKMLMALYLLAAYGAAGKRYLFIDEPDNFVYLAEIQPWLQYMDNYCTGDMQCVLISHHPVVIDYLASGNGIWLKRAGYGATRVVEAPTGDGILSASEYIARNV